MVYSGRDCMSNFFQHIHSEQLRINKILNEIVPMKDLTPEQIRDYRNAKSCYNCGVEFSSDQDDENCAKNRDHNHLDGQYIGPACSRCNLLRRYKQATRPKKNKPATYEIPIFFHNLRGYDSHLLLEHFPPLTNQDRVNCIATNFEQFFTFSYRGLKFVDSYQFLKSPLSILAENLKKSGEEKFVHTKRHFDEHFDLMTRKGVYCYSYMTSFDKFDETELPPIDRFYNDLSETYITETRIQARERCVEQLQNDKHETVPWPVSGDRCVLSLADVMSRILSKCVCATTDSILSIISLSPVSVGTLFFIEPKRKWNFSLTRKCIYSSNLLFAEVWPQYRPGTL